MHYNYSPGRMNVEKTPKQCYLGYHNSQRTERCLMGQVLKWGFGWSTSVKSRWLERAYIICKSLLREGTRKKERILWHGEESYCVDLYILIKFLALSFRVTFQHKSICSYSCVPLTHATIRLNLLKPSSLAHNLQEFIMLGFLDQGL